MRLGFNVKQAVAGRHPAFNSSGEEIKVRRLIIKAGNQLKAHAAGGQKNFLPLTGDLFDGFKAIGDEGGTYDEKPLRT